MRFPLRVARAVGCGLADLVWPPRCPVCDGVVESPGAPGSIHPPCLHDLEPARAVALRFGRERVPLHALLADRPAWFALLHRVKYGGEFSLLDPVVDRAVVAIEAGGGVAPGTVFVPVPDDPDRRRARGGSVVGRVATRLAAGLGVRARDDLLRRSRATTSQTQQDDDDARVANVAGAFGVGRLAELPRAARLVIVDDQATSGATLTEVVRLARTRGHPCAVLVLARARRTPEMLVP